MQVSGLHAPSPTLKRDMKLLWFLICIELPFPNPWVVTPNGVTQRFFWGHQNFNALQQVQKVIIYRIIRECGSTPHVEMTPIICFIITICSPQYLIFGCRYNINFSTITLRFPEICASAPKITETSTKKSILNKNNYVGMTLCYISL